MHVNIYMMHACIYIYFYAWIVWFNTFIVLEPKHTIRAYKCIISRVQYDFENLFWKENKKWKEKKKKKKLTFSPGWYYQPGLKGAGPVACQEAPLVPVGVTHRD